MKDEITFYVQIYFAFDRVKARDERKTACRP